MQHVGAWSERRSSACFSLHLPGPPKRSLPVDFRSTGKQVSQNSSESMAHNATSKQAGMSPSKVTEGLQASWHSGISGQLVAIRDLTGAVPFKSAAFSTCRSSRQLASSPPVV